MKEVLATAKGIAFIANRMVAAAQSGDTEIVLAYARDISSLSSKMESLSEGQGNSKFSKVSEGVYSIRGDSPKQIKEAKDFLRRRGFKSPKEGEFQEADGNSGTFFRQMGGISIMFGKFDFKRLNPITGS